MRGVQMGAGAAVYSVCTPAVLAVNTTNEGLLQFSAADCSVGQTNKQAHWAVLLGVCILPFKSHLPSLGFTEQWS